MHSIASPALPQILIVGGVSDADFAVEYNTLRSGTMESVFRDPSHRLFVRCLHSLQLALLAGLLTACLSALAISAEHPGNIFILGEDVQVPVPANWTAWQVANLEGNEIAHGTPQTSSAHLGKLPIGYFELREKIGGDRITIGVVARNSPAESTPIALDAAMSWFYAEPEKIRDACALCRLAGVKWVRDRLSWPELEPARGTMAEETRYERAMRIQHEAGLKMLQVNHATPSWATSNQAHFPDDLRDVHSFYRRLAQRWHGLVDAIEPWNEPDLDLFGGHTGCEIASFQKAAFLGLKSGDPKLTACEAVFAIDRAETLDEFGKNEVYPYFDRYNLHHYTGLDAYPRAYARHRAVSGGRPMWTTEFNLTVHWADEKTKEPSDEELRVQAYRVSKVFATALHEGIEKAFYFILGDYVERNLQHGLVHQDLTPRPAYVAFAAVGRLLNDAKPFGKVNLGDVKLKAYLFKTMVDGAPAETIVAWSETIKTQSKFPTATKAYDCLGRELPNATSHDLTHPASRRFQESSSRTAARKSQVAIGRSLPNRPAATRQRQLRKVRLPTRRIKTTSSRRLQLRQHSRPRKAHGEWRKRRTNRTQPATWLPRRAIAQSHKSFERLRSARHGPHRQSNRLRPSNHRT
jgi:hypothetical protein